MRYPLWADSQAMPMAPQTPAHVPSSLCSTLRGGGVVVVVVAVAVVVVVVEVVVRTTPGVTVLVTVLRDGGARPALVTAMSSMVM